MTFKETEDGILIDKDFYDKLIERLDKVNEIIDRLDKVESLIQEQNFAEMGFADLPRKMDELNKNFSEIGSAEEFFEHKVNTMVETLLSIYIFGNKTQCYNHWCDEISTALMDTKMQNLARERKLPDISDIFTIMEASPLLCSFLTSDYKMKRMIVKVEGHEGKLLKERSLERYREFLYSAINQIKLQATQNPIESFETINIRNALAIYADLDDLYFKENPDVERPNYEFFSKK